MDKIYQMDEVNRLLITNLLANKGIHKEKCSLIEISSLMDPVIFEKNFITFHWSIGNKHKIKGSQDKPYTLMKCPRWSKLIKLNRGMNF